mgnify:CR=1 FL=1
MARGTDTMFTNRFAQRVITILIAPRGWSRILVESGLGPRQVASVVLGARIATMGFPAGNQRINSGTQEEGG